MYIIQITKYSFNLIMNHNKSGSMIQKVIIRQFYMILFAFYLLRYKNFTNMIIGYIIMLFFL